jgi:hypothetical protein
MEKLLAVYEAQRLSEDEDFLTCFERIGMAPFKEQVYA